MPEIRGSRIVVTGGAGFIGSHLVDCLLDSGCSVLVLDDFSTGDRRNLERHCGNSSLSIIDTDVRNEDAMMELMAGARFVFHLAARGVRFSLGRPSETHDVNATGTLNVLKAASAAGVERLLYCSSSEAVGVTDGTHASGFNPETIYGASKLAGEYYAKVFCNRCVIETVIARPFNCYGPRSHFRGYRGEMIPRFIVSALAGKPLTVFGSGDQTRDFTYVTETAALLVEIMETGSPGKTLEICSGEERSVSQIAELILNITGSGSEILYTPGRPGDVSRMRGNPAPLREAVGRASEIGMEKGLLLTVDWFRKNITLDDKTAASVSPRNWEDLEPENAAEPAVKKTFAGPEIPLATPFLGEAEARAARRAILSSWVAQGPRVKDFEDAFAQYTGAPYSCAVSSGTTALHLALLAVGVRHGDTVITVSHSFIATANAVRHCGAEPVFVDIDPGTLNMSPLALENCLRNDFENRNGALYFKDVERIASGESPLLNVGKPEGRLAAIMPVHQAGLPADMEKICAVAAALNIPVVEDAACAAGSSILSGDRWEMIGKPRGDIACFSFHPRKILTTGEGGMVTTGNPEYDRTVRLLRHHGMSVSDLERHCADSVIVESYSVTGYNYRMSDIQAAVGIEQLRRLPGMIDRRREIAGLYDSLLAGVSGVKTFAGPEWARGNRQSYIVRLEDSALQFKILEAARRAGIAAKPGIMNAHIEPPYSGAWPAGSLPASEDARASCVILPLYHGMTEKDIRAVVAVLSGCIVK